MAPKRSGSGFLDSLLRRFGYVQIEKARIHDEPTYWDTAYGISAPQPYGSTYDAEGQQYAYKSWVYTCVSAIAAAAAMVPLRLYQVTGQGESQRKVELYKHPMLDVLRKPNPFMTRFELFEGTLSYLEINGNAFWVYEKDRLGRIAEVWLANPKNMRIVPSKKKFIAGYVYVTDNNKQIPLDVNEVLHFKYFNPLDDYWGMSPIQAAELAIITDVYSAKFNKDFFKNGALLSGVLETDRFLSETAFKRIRQQIAERYQGVGNAHRMMILQEGLKYKELTMNQKDMDFLKQRKFNREEIFSIFGVPPAKVGIMEDADFRNAEAQDYTFKADTLAPKMTRIQERLNADFVTHWGDDLLLEFDDVIPAREEKKARVRQINLLSGYTTINEERAKEGLPPVPWGDAPFNPNTMTSGVLELGDGEEDDEKALDKIADLLMERFKKKQDDGEDEPDRDEYWQGFMDDIEPHEREFKRKLVKLFQEQQNEVSRKLRGEKKLKQAEEVGQYLFDEEEQNQEFIDTLYPVLFALYIAFGARAFAQVGVDLDPESALPTAADKIRERAFQFARQVNRTTLERLRQTLIEGLENGESTPQLVDRVAAVFKDRKKSDAEMIAITETQIAAGWATFDAWVASGVVKEVEWITARDERVRPTHRAQDGMRRPLGTPFPNGLRFPGDWAAGKPEEVIRCRCFLLPIL